MILDVTVQALGPFPIVLPHRVLTPILDPVVQRITKNSCN